MLKLTGHTHAYAFQPLEVALRELASLGFQSVDIWATARMGEHLMPGQADPQVVRALLREYGQTADAVSGFGGDRELIRGRMELAAAIGARYYVCAVPNVPDWADQVDFYLETAKSYGLEMAFENHKFTPVETEQQLRDFLARWPDPALGIAFAPTHYYTCGFDPEAGVRLCADRLKLMYLWDVKKDIVQGSKAPHHEDPRTQIPGGGKLDWVSIARTLDEIGYSGWCEIFFHGTYEWAPAETNALFQQGIEHVRDAWDQAGVTR